MIQLADNMGPQQRKIKREIRVEAEIEKERPVESAKFEKRIKNW